MAYSLIWIAALFPTVPRTKIVPPWRACPATSLQFPWTDHRTGVHGVGKVVGDVPEDLEGGAVVQVGEAVSREAVITDLEAARRARPNAVEIPIPRYLCPVQFSIKMPGVPREYALDISSLISLNSLPLASILLNPGSSGRLRSAPEGRGLRVRDSSPYRARSDPA